MVKRKLSKGVHEWKGRRVLVKANGQWKFLKGKTHKTSTSRSTPKRVHKRVRHMARRRYSRRGRRSSFHLPSIFGAVAGLYAADKMGVFTALGDLVNGKPLGTVGSDLSAHANMNDMITAALPAVGVVLTRKFIGPVQIAKVGRFTIRLF